MIISKRRYNQMKVYFTQLLDKKDKQVNKIIDKLVDESYKIIKLNTELKKEKEFNNYLLEAIRILEDRVRQEMIRNFKYID